MDVEYKIRHYLSKLKEHQRLRLNPAMVANAINCLYTEVVSFFSAGVFDGSFTVNFEAVCPEASCLIETVDHKADQKEYIVECFRCGCPEHTIHRDNLVKSYNYTPKSYKRKRG